MKSQARHSYFWRLWMSLPQRRTRLFKDIKMLLDQQEFKIATENMDTEHLIDNAFTLRMALYETTLYSTSIEFDAPEESPFWPSQLKTQVSFPPR